MSKAREVQAFFCEMSMEPSQALAVRSKAMKVAAFVDHGYVHGLAEFVGFLFGGGDDSAGVC